MHLLLSKVCASGVKSASDEGKSNEADKNMVQRQRAGTAATAIASLLLASCGVVGSPTAPPATAGSSPSSAGRRSGSLRIVGFGEAAGSLGNVLKGFDLYQTGLQQKIEYGDKCDVETLPPASPAQKQAVDDVVNGRTPQHRTDGDGKDIPERIAFHVCDDTGRTGMVVTTAGRILPVGDASRLVGDAAMPYGNLHDADELRKATQNVLLQGRPAGGYFTMKGKDIVGLTIIGIDNGKFELGNTPMASVGPTKTDGIGPVTAYLVGPRGKGAFAVVNAKGYGDEEHKPLAEVHTGDNQLLAFVGDGSPESLADVSEVIGAILQRDRHALDDMTFICPPGVGQAMCDAARDARTLDGSNPTDFSVETDFALTIG